MGVQVSAGDSDQEMSFGAFILSPSGLNPYARVVTRQMR